MKKTTNIIKRTNSVSDISIADLDRSTEARRRRLVNAKILDTNGELHPKYFTQKTVRFKQVAWSYPE
jgi:hypothetical protein